MLHGLNGFIGKKHLFKNKKLTPGIIVGSEGNAPVQIAI